MRIWLRDLYSAFFYIFAKLFIRNVKLLSPLRIRKLIGESLVLRIVAPGASIIDSDKYCVLNDNSEHVLGLNYFSECRSLRLWDQASVFVIEPHPLFRRYLESIEKVVEQKGKCVVVVKGFSSPKKFFSGLHFIYALAKIPNLVVFLSVDKYLADLPHRYPNAVLNNPSRIISGAKSLHWALSYAFVHGYQKVILHGIDFSSAYVYPTSTDKTSEFLPPNTWVNDKRSRENTLKDIADLRSLMEEAGVLLVHAGCLGPIETILSDENADFRKEKAN